MSPETNRSDAVGLGGPAVQSVVEHAPAHVDVVPVAPAEAGQPAVATMGEQPQPDMSWLDPSKNESPPQ